MSRTRQNLRWKRKKPTLENPKTYVGNSRFLGRVLRRQMAALPIAKGSTAVRAKAVQPFPVTRAPVNVRSDSGQRPTLRSAMSAFGLDPGAPVAARAICASMRPLDVYLYAFGAQGSLRARYRPSRYFAGTPDMFLPRAPSHAPVTFGRQKHVGPAK